MKKKLWVSSLLFAMCITACNKSGSSTSQLSLTPSATQTTVGSTISVALTSSANAVNWTVTPSTNVTKTYGLTTSKINNFTFNQAGMYIISVRARSIAYDSTAHQSLDSCWKAGNGSRGGCTKGVDSTSVSIVVSKQ